MNMTIAYKYYGQKPIYLNITNRCTNKCKFCIRYTDVGVEGVDLWLEHEPSVEEIKNALIENNYKECEEVVFCGYGEPTMRYETICEVGKFIKETAPNIKIRMNTNGHGNKVANRDITPLFAGIIDEVSISLNEKNAQKYNEICVCDFGEDGFYELLDFAKKAQKHIPKVMLSIVDVLPSEDIEECKKVAEEAGIPLRIREMIE